MSFGKKTGIGPALRVVRHFIERRRYYQLKFASGEQAIVLIAGMPAPSIEVVRLGLGGLLPWQTIWEFNPTRAGGYSDYIDKLKAMFSPPTGKSDDSDHYIRETLQPCRSIEEVRNLLFDRERHANSVKTKVDGGYPRYESKSLMTDEWQLGPDTPPIAPPTEKSNSSAIPNRYRITGDDRAQVLTCVEAPMVMIRARRGMVIPEKQARSYQAGTIFLDGAADGEPFADAKRDLYNLNHPEASNQFAATCEQAIVLLHKGLDLGKRDWIVLANDSDLDTIFAVWVLLNHVRLNDNPEVRTKIMPLLRLEGAIDAHGPEAQYLSALPPDLIRSTTAMRKQLQQQEFVLKSYGQWLEFDLLEYIADRLRAIDDLIYAPENFDRLHEIDELARTEIAGRSVAIACRSNAGMDEAERQLVKFFGERLGILIFQQDPLTYRLRQLDRNLPANLARVYDRLNLVDPAVTGGVENRWGGSTETGGSPRKTGTGLNPTQIITAVREAFWKPTFLDVVSELPGAVGFALAVMSPALALIWIGNLLRSRGYIAGDLVFFAAVVLALTGGILFGSKARGAAGLYGWRMPMGSGWANVLPAALIGAGLGGVWAPGSLAYRWGLANLHQLTGLAALLLPLAAELLFRGVILGHLAARLPIQRGAGPWWNSWPNLISTSLYTAASLILFVTIFRGEVRFSQWILIVGGSAILGSASAVARERSESILASVLVHWVCAAVLLLCSHFLF